MKHVSVAQKAIVNIPAWAQAFNEGTLGGGDVETAAGAYNQVPLFYRATKLRSDSLAGVPMLIMRGEKETDWPFDTDLYSLIWKTEASLLLTGAAYWLKRSNQIRIRDLQWINPLTMSVERKTFRDKTGNEYQENIFRQTGGENPQTWSEDEIVYFREFTLDQDIGPGVGAGQAALKDGRLLNYITAFAGQFFNGGAMPVTMISFDSPLDKNEKERVEGWFRQRISGIRNAFKAIAISKRPQIDNLTPPMKDMDFQNLELQARRALSAAFGIPMMMMDDAPNRATAGEHRLGYWQDTVKPRAPLYENVINKQLLDDMGLSIKWNFEVLDIFQKDVNEGAKAVETLVNAGYDVGLASEVVGIELPAEWTYEQLTANATVTPEETEPEPTDDEDMKKWQTKALKRLKSGKPAQCTFESDSIDPLQNDAIYGNLADAVTAEDVKAVFSGDIDVSVDLAAELKRANDLLELTI